MAGVDLFTKLMLHGQTTLDSSNSSHVQTFYGASILSTTQAKFGNSSFKFTATTGDYVTSSNTSDFDFGAGDFTIDYWAYEIANGAAPITHIARDKTATWTPWIISYNGTVWMSSNGSTWDIASSRTLGAPVYNTWSHIEVNRSGNVFRTFRNGVQQDTWTSTLAFPPCSSPLSIGACQGANHMNGYIDELRISKGIARHTANFTPETSEYTTPPVIPGVYGQVVAMVVANNQASVDLIDTTGTPCDHYQIEFYSAVSDIETPPNPQAGAVLTAYITTDGGQSFYTGPNYNNTGDANFPGESNPLYQPEPFGFGTPQSLNLGMRLSVDSGDYASYGATGIAHVFNIGGHTTYRVDGYKGAIGGNANAIRAVGTKPTGAVGNPWFPSNGTQYFHWAIPISYAGHFDGAVGQRPNGFRLKMNGGGNNTALIESGVFKLRRLD